MSARISVIFLLACLWPIVSPAQDVWEKDVLGHWLAPSFNAFAGAASLPNGVKYLPSPVDTTQLTFAGDFYRWQWGKMIRENARGTKTVRGNQAYFESQYGLNRMCIIMAQAIGLTITNAATNPRRTPKMVYFIYHTGETGAAANQYAKQKYMRRRPFDLMHETTWGKYDTYEDLMKPGNGSFPSSHTSFGWAVALSLAEMIPERQDTILRRGYMYGESREIVGAHWHTDVDAGRLTASAAVAYLHSMSSYRDSLKVTQEEYYSLKGGEPDTDAGWPKGRKIMDGPVDSLSALYYDDVAGYWQAKADRNTDRGLTAIDENDDSDIFFLRKFSEIIGDSLDPGLNTYMAAVLSRAREALEQSALELRSTAFRKRPYVQFGEPSLIPQDEDYYAATSSYPSVKAQVGWGLALLMVEMFPQKGNDLLKWGYDYGYNRVVAGYNYPSDVMAGRIQASSVLARLHADEEFRELIELAKEEYNYHPKIVTVLDDVPAAPTLDDGYWYTTTGIALKGRPTQPGIYIHAGRKVFVDQR